MKMDPKNINKYDIGLFIHNRNQLSDADKYSLISNLWMPDSNYKFPTALQCKRKRSFLYNWLTTFKGWLAYSALYDGAFCYACVLFGIESGHNKGKLSRLFQSPLNYWSSAYTKMKNHEDNCTMHKLSVLAMTHFIAVMEGKQSSARQLVSGITNDRIQKNRLKLLPIIKTVIFCGRQNVPLRGHRDDSKEYESTTNTGNFQELINFRIDSGDKVLKDHAESAKRNAVYRSKTIQNEIIECCGEYLQEKLISEIKKAKFFSVLADETPDVSNKEQMPVSIRFVDSKAEIREVFMEFVHCQNGTSAVSIKSCIMDSLQSLGLERGHLRGQGYDGASNMGGKCAGAAKVIREECPSAVYVHCFAHRLNLCVASSCEVSSIKNMMETVRLTSSFFSRSTKRQALLLNNVRQYTPEERHTVLINVCKTRWVERIDGLDRFEEMFETVLLTLEEIGQNTNRSWDKETAAKANNLFVICSTFDFIFSLVVAKYFLYLLLPITSGIQKRDLDIKKAYDEVDFVLEGLKNARTAIAGIHEKLFEKSVVLGRFAGTVPEKKRICKRQNNRSNVPSESVTEYYRRNITVPFLDHLTQEIKDRFDKCSLKITKGFSAIPNAVLSNKNDGKWKDDFMAFCSDYSKDVPSKNSLEPEMLLWETYWTSVYKEEIPHTIAKTLLLTHEMKHSFPNIYTALRIMATVPVTSCECERAVSVLRRLKSYLRSTMSQERLNSLALMTIHRQISIDPEAILNTFARKQPRKMQLLNILDSN